MMGLERLLGALGKAGVEYILVGGGGYDDLVAHSSVVRAFGRDVRLIDLPWLIRLKRAAGRPRDFEMLAELEALLEERSRPDSA